MLCMVLITPDSTKIQRTQKFIKKQIDTTFTSLDRIDSLLGDRGRINKEWSNSFYYPDSIYRDSVMKSYDKGRKKGKEKRETF